MSISAIRTHVGVKHDLPAEVTVDSGKLSLEARKDIKKGTSDIWFIAFKALFEVSLVFVSSRDASHHRTATGYLRQAPEDRYHIVCELVDELLRILGRVLWRCEELGQSARDLVLPILERKVANGRVGCVTLGTNVLRGARMFLLYISAQMSNPPSIQRFLHDCSDVTASGYRPS